MSKRTFVAATVLTLCCGQAIGQVSPADVAGLTVINQSGVEPALSINDAPCILFVPHFDTSPAWISGLVVQNVGFGSNQVSVAAMSNDPLDPLTGSLKFAAVRNFALKDFEKQAWTLSVSGANNTMPTGVETGTMILLSEKPISAFVLYGTKGENIFGSLAGTGMLYSDNWASQCYQ